MTTSLVNNVPQTQDNVIYQTFDGHWGQPFAWGTESWLLRVTGAAAFKRQVFAIGPTYGPSIVQAGIHPVGECVYY